MSRAFVRTVAIMTYPVPGAITMKKGKHLFLSFY
jgi:hypothetical protein